MSTDGPASWIVLAEPRNSPAPIAMPSAMKVMWRGVSRRCSCGVMDGLAESGRSA